MTVAREHGLMMHCKATLTPTDGVVFLAQAAIVIMSDMHLCEPACAGRW